MKRTFEAVAFTALFGAAVGSYTGGLQILFAAVKMPVFFLGTLGLCYAAMHLLALLAAPELRARRTLALAIGSIHTTSRGLAALAPVVALFSLTSPFPSYKTYLFLVLLLVVALCASGALSLRLLWRELEIAGLSRPAMRRIFVAWIAVYGFTGSQLGWLLRPWVGSSEKIRGYFSIHRNLEGNVYEAIFRLLKNLVS